MSDELIPDLTFGENGLIPAVVQDEETGEVLMMAWMNGESFARTLQTGEAWFWSRSRQELWHKGATSGNTQRVTDVRLDCDGDTLLLKVRPAGPACHTGERTCFHRTVPGAATGETVGGKIGAGSGIKVADVTALDLGLLLGELYHKIAEREQTRPEKSYTTYLFNEGIDKILKKVGEEAAETIIAAKNASSETGHRQLTSEICDLLYHLLVLMVERGVLLPEIIGELTSRVGRPALAKYGTRAE